MCHCDSEKKRHCCCKPKTITWVEDVRDFANPNDPETYDYANVREFSADYSVVDAFHHHTNKKIGTSRFDTKQVLLPGSLTITFNSVSALDSENPEHPKNFIYIAGTRSYELVQGPPIVAYESAVVQNIVYNGKNYYKGNVDYVLLPNKKQIRVTVTF